MILVRPQRPVQLCRVERVVLDQLGAFPIGTALSPRQIETRHNIYEWA